MKFTDLALQRLRPPTKRTIVWDDGGNGFGLRLSPSGTKTFVYMYRHGTRKRMMTLGEFPAVTLAEARRKHATAWEQHKRGMDPAERQIVAKRTLKAEPTVRELLAEYQERELAQRRSGPEIYRMLEKDLLPTLGHKKTRDVTRRDVVLLLDKVRTRAPILANRLQGRIVRLFNFAADRGVIEFNPLHRMSKPKEEGRDRILSDAEICTFWFGIDDVALHPLTVIALKLVLVLGQRPGEIAAMAEAELTGDVWTIPAERYKTAERHVVPLPPLALELIDAARILNSGSPYIFPSLKRLGKEPPEPLPPAPLDRHSLSRAVRRKLGDPADPRVGCLNMTPFTPHDLRRTMRTKLAELGVQDHIAERVMGHKLQGMLAIYNRHDYVAEKRDALTTWSDHLQTLTADEGAYLLG